MPNDLIYDIGFHKGEDTGHYLRSGFRVVAVEANPTLAADGKVKFKKEIGEGRLTLLNIGIAMENRTLEFWVNEDKSEWSSFDREIGCRLGTRCHAIPVECTRMDALIAEYGLPFYVKIDIEGYDIQAIDSLDRNSLPKYISCEAVHIEWLHALKDLGYTKFKIINQGDGFRALDIQKERSPLEIFKRHVINGIKLRTSNLIRWEHPIMGSGPFAEKTDGPWKSAEEVERLYREFFQFEKNTPLNPSSWFDFHAAL